MYNTAEYFRLREAASHAAHWHIGALKLSAACGYLLSVPGAAAAIDALAADAKAAYDALDAYEARETAAAAGPTEAEVDAQRQSIGHLQKAA